MTKSSPHQNYATRINYCRKQKKEKSPKIEEPMEEDAMEQ